MIGTLMSVIETIFSIGDLVFLLSEILQLKKIRKHFFHTASVKIQEHLLLESLLGVYLHLSFWAVSRKLATLLKAQTASDFSQH